MLLTKETKYLFLILPATKQFSHGNAIVTYTSDLIKQKFSEQETLINCINWPAQRIGLNLNNVLLDMWKINCYLYMFLCSILKSILTEIFVIRKRKKKEKQVKIINC